MTDQGHNTTPRSASPLGNGLGVHPELHLGNTDGRGGGTARGAANGSSPPPPVPSSSDKIVPPSAMVESSPFSSSTSEKRTILEPSSVNAEVSGRQNQTSSQGSTEPNSPDGALKENGNRDNQGNHGIKYMGATSNNDSASCASDYIVSGSNKMPKWATRYLAPWFIHHLKNPRTWKTFVRIMVVLLANLILMVDNKSESRLHTSTKGVCCPPQQYGFTSSDLTLPCFLTFSLLFLHPSSLRTLSHRSMSSSTTLTRSRINGPGWVLLPDCRCNDTAHDADVFISHGEWHEIRTVSLSSQSIRSQSK